MDLKQGTQIFYPATPRSVEYGNLSRAWWLHPEGESKSSRWAGVLSQVTTQILNFSPIATE
uniref:Uncharacterized protein n=1 Tax=Picea glauca TaxID=3330 RepID=A0A101M4L9_PICGL|nr:hypothetical protein ABT39_MTgene842 [Picea glauca]QHR88311.1 hypothetical protein Q903MT_gene2324 [Picea sitchensis]